MTIDFSLYNASVLTGGIVDLSPSSLALAVLAVGRLHKRYLWADGENVLTDSQWNDLDYEISECLDELMSNIVGMIFPAVFASAFSANLLPCDGSLYDREDYPVLYDRLPPALIVGGSAFVTPDLRDRVVVGSGNDYTIDQAFGSDFHTLTIDELPAHSHSYNQYTFGIDIESVGVPDPTGVGQPSIPQSTSSVGNGFEHENRQRSKAYPWYIVAR